MSVCFIPPYTPLLYSKSGVYRGIHYFLIFALKHILWVLVRTTTIYVLSKKMKIVQKILIKIVIFTAVKNRCILHGRVFVIMDRVEKLFYLGYEKQAIISTAQHSSFVFSSTARSAKELL